MKQQYSSRKYIKEIFKKCLFPLHRGGIKGEAGQRKLYFTDACNAQLWLLLAALLWAPFSLMAQKPDIFDKWVNVQMKADSIPGATLLIAQHGQALKTKGYGTANLENGTPATPATRYELASISKPVTATAIMLLVEQGKLHPDSSVAAYIPGAPEAYRNITLRHLMSHTGGVPSDHYAHTKLYAPGLIRYTAKDQLTDLFKIKNVVPPGTKFMYSNAAYFLQGAIIEQVTGKTCRQFIQEEILNRAGMTNTSFLNTDSIVPNRAQGYTKRKGKWVRFSLELLLQSLDANGFSALIADAADLDKFCLSLSEGKIISDSAFKKMQQPVKLNDGSNARFASHKSEMGLGWIIKEIKGRKWIFHTGHTGTLLMYQPEERITIAFLTNLGAGYGNITGDKGFRIADFGFILAEEATRMYIKGNK